jgi:hypothetical protein
MTWDTDIPMAGTIQIHWSVTRGEDGEVRTWYSPFVQLPEEPVVGDDGEVERRGLEMFLAQGLTTYPDQHLAMASARMSELATDDFVMVALANPVYKALKEQREREGGYVEPDEAESKNEAEEA